MAQNATATDEETQKERVLRVLDEHGPGLESAAVADRLDDDSTSGVRGTLSTLKDEGYVETAGRGGPQSPYLYSLTDEGQDLLDGENGDDEAEETGLAALFDSKEEGDTGTNGATEDEGVSDEAFDELERLEDRVDALEQSFSNSIKRETVETVEDLSERVGDLERTATGDGGGDAPLCLPVADGDADLDHATIIYGLGSRRKVRHYLRALLDLPEGQTDSEARAESEEAVAVVEKDERDA